MTGDPLAALEPAPLWRHFAALSRIPRPSRHEAAVQRHVLALARHWGLEAQRDPVGNVIVRKPASDREMAGRRGVILQGHLDMVPQANAGSGHDFTCDPIRPRIDGAWVTAEGTTLGADNGIGVAATLAVLESRTLRHGPLEALFTCNEEDGMEGASGLRSDALEGRILINTDSEEEGELCIGCAGGVNVSAVLPYRPLAAAAGQKGYRLSLTGLRGGHSGVDIHLGRGNAAKLLFRLLQDAMTRLDLQLSELRAGDLRNAIPREAFARVSLPGQREAELAALLAQWQQRFLQELGEADPGLRLELTPEPGVPPELIDPDSARRLVACICSIPDGVMRMSDDMPGLVETSNNLGVVAAGNGRIDIHNLVRSTLEPARQALAGTLCDLLRRAGAECRIDGEYPGWRPDPASPILATSRRVYRTLFDREARVGAIHAGLECGLLGDLMPGLDMISFGPTIRHPHSPDERVHIPSVARFWRLLTGVLEQIPAAAAE